MQLREHGGGCCGLRHLSGFSCKPSAGQLLKYDDHGAPVYSGKTQLDLFDGYIAQIDQYNTNAKTFGKTIECILTSAQIQSYPEWLVIFHERGFKLVNRVRNTTGRVLNIFHRSSSVVAQNDWLVKEPLAGWKYDK